MSANLPSTWTVFKGVFAVHLLSVVWNTVGDCDETFNYWEPLHFLIYGYGFQTWEYAPQFGLRSYAYTWLFGLPAFLGNRLFGLDGRCLFYMTRLLFALVASCAEAYLYTVLKCRFRSVGSLAVLVTIFFSFSSGSFIATTAFLPSSFAMYLSTVMLASWLNKNYRLAIACVAASAIIGWPFSAALGLPLAFDMIFIRRRLCAFLRYSFQAGFIFALPLVLIDSFYYGKLVIAPLNILKYNVFSEHGPELYGTEPFDFYIRNYILNFNIVFFLFATLPIFVLIVSKQDFSSDEIKQLIFSLMPSIIWNGIFFLQPHKEERFLYPVYPFVSLAAAVSLCIFTRIVSRIFKNIFGQIVEKFVYNGLHGCAVVVFLLLSTARVLALVLGYGAPLVTYGEFTQPEFLNTTTHPKNENVFVCAGREWYRFPSHFFLHSSSKSLNLRLKLIRSEFQGQLPAEYNTKWGNATRLLVEHFNDANFEEKSRYWPVDKCDYLVDRNTPGKQTLREPNYAGMKEWKIVWQSEFLDAEASPLLPRVLYIPSLFRTKNTFLSYVILKRVI